MEYHGWGQLEMSVLGVLAYLEGTLQFGGWEGVAGSVRKDLISSLNQVPSSHNLSSPGSSQSLCLSCARWF